MRRRQTLTTAARRCRWTWPVLLALAWPMPARADDWPTPGLDGSHARRSSERSGAAFADGRWSYTPGPGVWALASPVVSDGYLVTADLDGTVTAVAEDSGRPLWQVNVGSSIQGTPVVASGRVFVPTLGNKVVALGLTDGAALWSTDVGGMTVSSPAIVNGDLVVGAGLPRQDVVRLDGKTGAIVWRSPAVMEQFSNTPPAVSGGLVVVGTNGGHYYAFDVASGTLRWDYAADGIVNIASPLVAGGRVYMAGGKDSDHVHAVDVATGAASAGWPVALPAPDPDLAGQRIYRRRSVSSFAVAGAVIVLETRLDDALDTDADGLADQYLSREWAIALDPTSGAIAWQRLLARVVFTEPGRVPPFVVCPTPAAFSSGAGQPLLAVASSLLPQVSVLDAGGADQGDLTTGGRALASPVMANGRLFTVAENGTVEGWLSTVNHPPAAPVLAANPHPLDASDLTLRWSPAMDADGDQPSYEVRIDSDGEILQTYAQQLFPADGASSVAVVAPLATGVTYTVAVRARDSHGALSPWSAPETFTVAPTPAVTVNGNPVSSLRAAVESAVPGDTILLGAGTYPISSTLRVPAGVTVKGAGAGRTIIDATGLSVGISFAATDPRSPTALDRTTVTGAATCLSIESGASGIELTHLVAHDCATAGIGVAAGGAATIANTTLASNGVGLFVAGGATIKNSLVAANAVGLEADGSGTLTSSYDDLFGNQAARQGLDAGTGDLSANVVFANVAAHDYRLVGPQPSTDRGDPADPAGDEPAPNGARINLGAYGGTSEAELSTPAPVQGDPTSSPLPTTATGTGGTTGAIGDDAGGCGLTGRAPGLSSLAFALSGLVLARRRRRR